MRAGSRRRRGSSIRSLPAIFDLLSYPLRLRPVRVRRFLLGFRCRLQAQFDEHREMIRSSGGPGLDADEFEVFGVEDGIERPAHENVPRVVGAVRPPSDARVEQATGLLNQARGVGPSHIVEVPGDDGRLIALLCFAPYDQQFRISCSRPGRISTFATSRLRLASSEYDSAVSTCLGISTVQGAS